MGIYSRAVFGRKTLPARCIIFAGVMFPASARRILRTHFDAWDRVRGYVPTYTFAKGKGIEYLLLFNVYGAAMMLDTLSILKGGNVKRIFFIGSMGSASCPIGTVVLPETVIDHAGIVLLDDLRYKGTFKVSSRYVEETKRALDFLKIDYKIGKVISVPSVLHRIKSIKKAVRDARDCIGIEMELSTFHYFSKRLGLQAFSLVFVSDNKTHELTSAAKNLIQIRRKARNEITKAALIMLS